MAVVAVSFNGTRVNDSDANTNWGNWGSSGGAPASEFPLAYQVTSGTTTGAVNKKISSATLGGIDYDPASGALDMTAAANRLWFAKVYVSDSFDLNTTEGVRLGIGSANNQYYYYNAAGSGANNPRFSAYPAQGGLLIAAIDPNISQWREGNVGTVSLTAVDWFGVQAAFVNGTAKSENLALDSIDIGTGLVLTGGDGASTDGDFTSFVATDQDVKANRWGVVVGAGDFVRSYGLLEIGRNTGGTAVATGFTDATSIVVFPDGYHSRGLSGVDVDLGSASTVVDIDCLLIGEGTRNGADADDTRPDFTVSGTSGSFTCGAQMRNFRDVTFTSVCAVDGADIECHQLTQGSADVENCVIRCNALANTACLQDPVFGATTDLNNTEFVQVGAGHAIEIDTAGDYTLTGLDFTGFNATDEQSDSAVYVSASTGTVNLTIAGGGSSTFSTRSAGATVNIIASTQVTLTGLVNGTEVTVYDAGDGSEIATVENVTGGQYAFTDTAANVVNIFIHKADYYRADIIGFTIPSNDTSVPVSQLFDPNYVNN